MKTLTQRACRVLRGCPHGMRRIDGMMHRRIIALFTLFILISSLGITFQGNLLPGEPRQVYAAQTSGPLHLPLVMQGYPLTSSMGVEMFSITTGRGGLQWVLETNTRWVRRNGLLWSQVEAVEGEYDWDKVKSLEQELINASNYNLQVILIVRSTPPWAQEISGYSCGRIKPEALQSFGDFLYEAVRRYSVPPYNVKYWQIWNEPDAEFQMGFVNENSFYGCWGDSKEEYFGGGYYGEVLKAVYPRIKEANPDVKVVLGGLLLFCNVNLESCGGNPNGLYFEGVLRSEGREDFDIVAYHSYDYYFMGSLGEFGNPLWGSRWSGELAPVMKARYLRSLMERYGISKPLIASEIGLTCGFTGFEPACQDPNYEITKAYYVAQSFASTLAEGIEASIWYSLNASWGGSELANKDGTTRPAYDAYKVVKAKLDGATFVRRLSEDYEGLNGFEFVNHRRRIWLVWTAYEVDRDPVPVTIQLPSSPLSISDVFGNPIDVSGNELTVSVMPLYIEWYAP